MYDHLVRSLMPWEGLISHYDVEFESGPGARITVTLHIYAYLMLAPDLCQKICDAAQPTMIVDVQPIVQRVINEQHYEEVYVEFRGEVHHGKIALSAN